jgi:tetratricopeptide (TPR) repeat protein
MHIRSLAWACSLVVVTGAALAAEPLPAPVPGPQRVTVAVFPPRADDAEGRRLALGLADRAGGLLFASGSYNHFHPKQLLAMTRHHALSLDQLQTLDGPEGAREAAQVLGTRAAWAGTLTRRPDGGYLLAGVAFDRDTGQRQDLRLELPRDAAAVVRDGGRAVAAAVAGLHQGRLPAEGGEGGLPPASDSGPAVEAYLACFATLVEQPLGLRAAQVLDRGRLSAARQACQRAVELDPAFGAAWATLSLAQALGFEDEAAARSLERAERARGYLPFAGLARYWLATRFQGPEDGARVLEAAVAAHPGALIFLTSLGEHLNVSKRFGDALEVWERYLKLVPDSPFGLAQKGYALARLGKLDEAIRLSRLACDGDTGSLELKLELASRLVDAQRLPEAETLLLSLASSRRVYGEVLLRLGYVYLLQRKDKEARVHLENALALARGPGEWRTRGRTRVDLAVLAARRGELAGAEQLLIEAADEGFGVADLLGQFEELKPLAAKAAFLERSQNPKVKAGRDLQFVTPFPVDARGESRPDGQRPAPITGIRF